MANNFFKTRADDKEEKEIPEKEFIKDKKVWRQEVDNLNWKYLNQKDSVIKKLNNELVLLKGRGKVLGFLDEFKDTIDHSPLKNHPIGKSGYEVIETVFNVMDMYDTWLEDLYIYLKDQGYLLDSASNIIYDLAKEVMILQRQVYDKEDNENDGEYWQAFAESSEGRMILSEIVPTLKKQMDYVILVGPQNSKLTKPGKEFLKYLSKMKKLPFYEINKENSNENQ